MFKDHAEYWWQFMTHLDTYSVCVLSLNDNVSLIETKGKVWNIALTSWWVIGWKSVGGGAHWGSQHGAERHRCSTPTESLRSSIPRVRSEYCSPSTSHPPISWKSPRAAGLALLALILTEAENLASSLLVNILSEDSLSKTDAERRLEISSGWDSVCLVSPLVRPAETAWTWPWPESWGVEAKLNEESGAEAASIRVEDRCTSG